MALNARLSRTAFFGLGLFAFTLIAERWRGNSWHRAIKSAFIGAVAVLTIGFLMDFWLASAVTGDVSSPIVIREYHA